mgnify:CR=1 FL=1
MLTLVTGGSGSGKSAFSEDISVLTEYIFSRIVKKDMAQTIRMNGVHRE